MRKSEEARPTVLIIHDKQRGVRLLEGILRNEFRVRMVANCHAAVEFIKADPPNLVLCDHVCLHTGNGELLDALTNDVAVLQIPLIVVTGDRPEENAQMLKTFVEVVDCVQRSVAPPPAHMEGAQLHLPEAGSGSSSLSEPRQMETA